MSGARLKIGSIVVTLSFAIVACGGLIFDPPDDLSVANDRDSGASDAHGGGGRDASRDAGSSLNADGWMALQGFDPACNVFVAPSPSAHGFPPPIAWKPCDHAVLAMADAGADSGIGCEQMADNFDGGVLPAPYTSPFGATSSGYVDRDSQRVLLPIARVINAGSAETVLVAEADGPVHQAFTLGAGSKCALGVFSSINHDHVIYRLDDYSADGVHENASAAIGGAIDGMSHVLRVEGEPEGELEPVAAGATVFADREYFSGTHVAPWDGPATAVIWKTDGWEMTFQGDDLFSSSADVITEILLTTAKGSVPFISLPNAATATDFGTDGADMVWIEAFDEGSDLGPWATVNIMAAPFTTDPNAIVKRRVRSGMNQPGFQPFTVGCGYAAHEYDRDETSGFRIVRLSDGRSWQFRASASSRAVAITCSEIFIDYSYYGSGLARIRLDSLGPGDPPD